VQEDALERTAAGILAVIRDSLSQGIVAVVRDSRCGKGFVRCVLSCMWRRQSDDENNRAREQGQNDEAAERREE
jgi:hypothetical protein